MKAMVFANKAMATRANLEREASNWMQEAGTMPPGNGAKPFLWTVHSVSSVIVIRQGAARLHKVVPTRLQKYRLSSLAVSLSLHALEAGSATWMKCRRRNLTPEGSSYVRSRS